MDEKQARVFKETATPEVKEIIGMIETLEKSEPESLAIVNDKIKELLESRK